MVKNKNTLGKKLKRNGSICITDRGRFFGEVGDDEHAGLIFITVDELEKLLSKAKKNSKRFKGLFCVHLSPDVTFGILPKKHEWLYARN